MKTAVKIAVAACFSILLCFVIYRVYDKTVSGTVERHEGVQIGELYLNGSANEKKSYDGITVSANTVLAEVVSKDAAPVASKSDTLYAGESTQEIVLSVDDGSDTLAVTGHRREDASAAVEEQENEEDLLTAAGQKKEEDYVKANADPAEFFEGIRNFGDGIEISWNPVRGAKSYRVYSLNMGVDGTVLDKVLVDNVAETRYIVKDMTEGKIVYVGVKPVMEEKGSKAKIKRIDLCKPTEIMSVRTNRISDEKVNLKWERSAGANLYRVCARRKNGFFTEIAEISDTSINIDLIKDSEYDLRIVPYFDSGYGRIRCEGSAMTKYKNVTGDVVSYDHQKYSSDECYEDIEILNMRYSDIMRTDVIGYSEDGREITDIVLGNEDADSALLVLCELHAREYITTVTMMRIVEFYLKNYYGTIDDTKVCDLLKDVCIHFVVMANPDGLEISQHKDSKWKANSKGVNLNQNFPYNFKVSGDPAKGTYTGDSEASSTEAQAVVRITRDLEQKYEKFGVLSYHAMGQIVFGSYKEDDELLKERIEEMYDTVTEATGYKDAGRLDGGPACGNYREYLIYVVGVPAVTIEVGATVCPCDVSEYTTAFEKNKYVVLREAALIANWNEEKAEKKEK